ncbi:hypothetical protein MKX01_037445, partial [Papaver californicum]
MDANNHRDMCFVQEDVVFFGTTMNLNMCSKCYKDHLKEEKQSVLVKDAFEKSANPNKALTTSPTDSTDDSNVVAKENTTGSPSSTSSSSTSGGES